MLEEEQVTTEFGSGYIEFSVSLEYSDEEVW